jgi:tripartite-type tricarboxylate transporter receptor subunit TctC
MLAQSTCALWAPAGTPAPAIAKLSAQATPALGAASMKDRLRAQGLSLVPAIRPNLLTRAEALDYID